MLLHIKPLSIKCLEISSVSPQYITLLSLCYNKTTFKVRDERMSEYHKIQTVFLRNPDSNYKNLLLGKFARPEFELLKNIDWVWTEKIDGTNIRIMWDGESVKFGGRTDNSQIRASLLEVLQNQFTVDKMSGVFQEQTEVCLYGEGYGHFSYQLSVISYQLSVPKAVCGA